MMPTDPQPARPSSGSRWDVGEEISLEPPGKRAHPFAPALDDHPLGARVGEGDVAAPPGRQRSERRADPQFLRESRIGGTDRHLAAAEQEKADSRTPAPVRKL